MVRYIYVSLTLELCIIVGANRPGKYSCSDENKLLDIAARVVSGASNT